MQGTEISRLDFSLLPIGYHLSDVKQKEKMEDEALSLNETSRTIEEEFE